MADRQRMSRLLNLASTSLLGAAGRTGTSIQQVLQQSTPGFGFLHAFFATWLQVDLTTLAAALTIFGTISGALQDLQGVALKIYWWITRFLTASISIGSSDRLNREILNWLGAKVLSRQGTRILTARSEEVESDVWHYRRTVPVERNEYNHEKRVPIQYLPTFGTTWFIHERTVFLVRRIRTSHHAANMPDEYASAPEGDEPLVVMCLGRSVTPIKRFFSACREFADKQRESFITIRASKNQYHSEPWSTTVLRPLRPMSTVHFDETTKRELVADIKNYLDPATRLFYTSRGIPYRRGFLLHGPPGTGKTSLSLALASLFGLELYLVHLPSIREDSELERLFTALPPRCIVLLEDIDVVGMKRQVAMKMDEDEEEEDDDEEDEEQSEPRRCHCTLSGVLNVLDGVSSQEGRIVLMTSNMAHNLDKALIRPGRIDRMIYLGNVSQRSAELMFLRMFDCVNSVDGELQKLALEFSCQIPEDAFTPAQLQGFLLNRRSSPVEAVIDFKVWVNEETTKMAEEKRRAKEVAAWKAKKRREASMKLLAKSMAEGDLDIVSENPTATSRENNSTQANKDGDGDTKGLISDNEDCANQDKGSKEDIVDSKDEKATDHSNAAEGQLEEQE